MQINRTSHPHGRGAFLLHGLIAAAGLAACLAASPALAGSRAEARLAQPVATPIEKIVDGRIWRCEGSLCVGATSLSASQPLKRECKRAARELGALVAYRSGGRELDPETVKSCNGR